MIVVALDQVTRDSTVAVTVKAPAVSVVSGGGREERGGGRVSVVWDEIPGSMLVQRCCVMCHHMQSCTSRTVPVTLLLFACPPPTMHVVHVAHRAFLVSYPHASPPFI